MAFTGLKFVMPSIQHIENKLSPEASGNHFPAQPEENPDYTKQFLLPLSHLYSSFHRSLDAFLVGSGGSCKFSL